MKKPSSQAIKRLISLHGWSGIIASVFLYIVAITGTVAVLADDIRRWSDPRREIVNPLSLPLNETVLRLQAQVPAAFQQNMQIQPARDGSLRVFLFERRFIQGRGTVEYGRDFLLNPETHAIRSARQGVTPNRRLEAPSDTLSNFIADLHARLLIPGRAGLFATGVLGVVLLVAAITGILIHRHLLRDLFVTARPGGRVVSLRDRHALASVWGLPFTILLAFTGTFLSFALSLGLPIVAASAFGGDVNRALAALNPPAKIENPAPAGLTDLDQVLAAASVLAGTQPSVVRVEGAGRADARITTQHLAGSGGSVRPFTLEFDGATGAFLQERPLTGRAASLGSGTVALMGPLHLGNFAGIASRAVWVMLGALLTVSIVTGVQLWLRRREEDPLWRGFQSLFTTVVWGVPIALIGAAYGFFPALLNGAPHQGMLIGFISAIIYVLAHCLTSGSATKLSARLQKTLAWALLLLPLLRLQTGGVSWGEAMVSNNWQVLLLDALCVAVSASLLMHARGFRNRFKTTLEAAE